MCLGGSAALARALAGAVREAGGEVLLQTELRRILTEHGRVKGVETRSGEVFQARHFVASGLNPQQTFLELLDDDLLPHEWKQRSRDFQYNLLAPLFALHLNLKEAPLQGGEEPPSSSASLHGDSQSGSINQFFEIVQHHEAGTIHP
jgi:phytoene dehydrogenase-like protein